jgi:short-subunit dehydrogenase
VSDKYVRIAAVTGATSGIGEATVRKFAAAGFGVVGNGRKAAKLAAHKMVDTQQNLYPKSAADIIIIGSFVGRNISPFSTVYGLPSLLYMH